MGEILREDAFVRESQTAKPYLKLYKGTYLDTDYPKGEFVRVGLTVYLAQGDFIQNSLIRKGAILVNSKGKKIGEVIADFEGALSERIASGKFETPLQGFIRASAIDPTSVPENDLNVLISKTRRSVPAKALEQHIKKYRYRDWLEHNSFISFVKFDSEQIAGPGIRVMLIFKNDKLFAMVHRHTLAKSRFFPVKVDDGYTIQYFSKDKNLIKSFEEGFYFQFKQAGSTWRYSSGSSA